MAFTTRPLWKKNPKRYHTLLMPTPLVECQRVSKTFHRRIRRPGLLGAVGALFSSSYETFKAVDALTFQVHAGERIGLIGENGAGKSTTIKMLTGILVPTQGYLQVLGRTPWKERRALAAEIGVVFGQRAQLLWDIPVRESFFLLRDLYRVPKMLFQKTFTQAVEQLNLGELLSKPTRQLSLGQRMRCDVAAALLHAPRIAFLDEPTLGLDLSIKEQVREFLVDFQKQFHITYFITSHDLKDITEICDRLLVLDQGRLLFDGTLKAFEKKYAPEKRLILELHRAPSRRKMVSLNAKLKKSGARLVEQEAHRLVVEYRKEGAGPRLTRLLLSELSVHDISLDKTDLETIVMRLYRTSFSLSDSEKK